jgi:hypothetical protein
VIQSLRLCFDITFDLEGLGVMRETDTHHKSGERLGDVFSIRRSKAKARPAAGSELNKEFLLDRVEPLETHDRPIEPRFAVVLVQQGLPGLVSVDQPLTELLLLHDLVVPLQFLADDGGP